MKGAETMIKIILIMWILDFINTWIARIYVKGSSLVDQAHITFKQYTKTESTWFTVSGLFKAVKWVISVITVICLIIKYL